MDLYFDDVTVSHTPSPIVSTSDYFPFGLSYNSMERTGSLEQKYLYNGKELQDEMALNWYDYGARMYMPEIGRWGVVDPLAEKAMGWTPYRYAFNNPLRFIDPDGMFEYSNGYTTQDSRFESGSVSHSGSFDNSKEANRINSGIDLAAATAALRQNAAATMDVALARGVDGSQAPPSSSGQKSQTPGVVLDVSGNLMSWNKGASNIYVNVDGKNVNFHDNLVHDGTMTADDFGNGLLSIVRGMTSNRFKFDESKLYNGKFSVAILSRDEKTTFSSNGGIYRGISSGHALMADGSHKITYSHINGRLTVDKLRSQLGVHEYYGHGLRGLDMSPASEALIKSWVDEYLSNPNR